MSHEVNSIAVIGAGTMGSGIALIAATSGIDAFQVDVSTDQLDRAKAYHAKVLGRNVQKERMTQAEMDSALARISYVGDMADAGVADWAVEAATENPEVKAKIFQSMRATFPEHAVLATNTSSISITRIATATGDAADRVVGMHFFNPVPVMKLVEVIPSVRTNEAVTASMTAFATDVLDKVVVAAKDRAGFVVNMLLVPYLNAAMRMYADGHATAADIEASL